MEEKVKVLTLHNQTTNTEDRYALGLVPIGQGKYAKVYRAVNMRNPSKVFAVKVIRIESEEVKKEYLKELRIIQNLPPCPNLVRTHKQHLESENNLYIFQEFCEGGTLMNFRSERQGQAGCLSEQEVYDLFFQVSNGLITLLQAGIVHEDIKPVNILKKGKVFKLCDFGVSEVQKQCKESTTRKGTISYMPPQKLRSRRFLPNEKSDIYSLGTCIYEIIFGFHPYLKRKTANYKEYLLALDEATLRPIPLLMKKIGSTSLRLQNFLKFLERMIDLNQKTRTSLAELKEFIHTTEPFKLMSPPQEHEEVEEQDRDSYAQNFKGLLESVIHYKKNAQDGLRITSEQPSSQPAEEEEEFHTGRTDHLLRETLQQRFKEENAFVVGVLGLLLRGIDYIRRSNFCELNLTPVGKNVTAVPLTDCKLSRYLKYLAFEFSQAVRKRQKEKYQEYLQEDTLQNLKQDRSFLGNQFNKFLIESSFANKQQFGLALGLLDSLGFWKEIQVLLNNALKQMSIVKENRKQYLLSILFCCHMPQLLECLASTRTIFGDKPIAEQMTESYIGDTSIERGLKVLSAVVQIQGEKVGRVREAVESQLQRREIQVLFQIEQSSGQIQVIQEQPLQ